MEAPHASTEHAVKKMARAVELFRALDNTIPSQVISVFLEIAASEGGIETRLLPERVGLTQASVSRALLYLSETDWHDTSRPGLELIVRRVSARDARQRVVELSPKGRKLARRIERVLTEEESKLGAAERATL